MCSKRLAPALYIPPHPPPQGTVVPSRVFLLTQKNLKTNTDAAAPIDRYVSQRWAVWWRDGGGIGWCVRGHKDADLTGSYVPQPMLLLYVLMERRSRQ